MRRLLLTFAVVACFSPALRAQTSYPMLSRIEPTAIQRGSTADLVIAGGGNGGGDFSGAFEVLSDSPLLKGTVLSTEKVERPAAKKKTQGRGMRRGTSVVKIQLGASADAPLGPRELRVATAQGVSSVGLVLVVNDPVVAEADDKANDSAKGAQALALPCVVSGTIGKTEDVDWYAIPARKGQRITFSVWANRLENKIHDLQLHFDPILLLHDQRGSEIAVDDNHDFADPMLSYEFKEDGTYFLEVRDTTYGGNVNWTYALQATAGPVATSVFPLAVNPGKDATLTAHGDNIDASIPIALSVPKDLPPGLWFASLPTSNGPTLATPLVVTSLPIVVEKDDAPAEPSKAQVVTLPSAVCGTLGAANDVDGFTFEAKKGQIYAFEIVARRAGSGIDPVLKIVDAKEAAIAEADDTPGLGKDLRLEWTAPADGPYTLQVSDLHSRGGHEFRYVLLAEPAQPDFVLTCDPDKLNVGPGGRVPLFVQVKRRAGFAGPVAIALENLPPGVSASPLTIPATMTQGAIVVSAAQDAKVAASLLSLKGKSKSGSIVREATPKQEIYLPGGGRGFYEVETLAAGVTEPSDIAVEASTKSITLAPGGTSTIDVTVTRKPGFEQGVNLAIILQHLGGIHANPLPPGVTIREAGSKTLLSPTETKGKIVLQAAPNAAPIENVPICVMGHVSINFVVKTAYASEPIQVSVAKK